MKQASLLPILIVALGSMSGNGDEPQRESKLETIELATNAIWHIDGATHHVQGLAATDEHFWISSVERATKTGWLFRVDRKSLTIVDDCKLVRGDRYHPGGMQLARGSLWLPVAEYRAKSSTTIVRVDPQTLAATDVFDVPDHIGALAADDEGRLILGNWDCRTLYVYSAEGERKAERANPTGVAYQDFELHDGLLWAAGAVREGSASVPVVDCIDTKNWRHIRRYVLRGKLGSGGTNFAREGMTKLGSNLMLLPEDGPHSTVYQFPLPGP